MTAISSIGLVIVSLAVVFYIVKVILNVKNRPKRTKYLKYLAISFVLMIFFTIMSAISVGSDSADKSRTTSADTAAKVVKKQKYIGKDKYQIAKKENVALIAKKKDLEKQNDKLQDQKDQIESADQAQKQKEAEAQAAAQKQQEEQAKAAEKQQAAASQQQSQTTNSQRRGDMNTADSGDIIGNSNTHVYHVPGQAGYNMNSANAVHFSSEQEAINAGYRRSKR